MNTEHSRIKDKILSEIRAGHVTMTPRAYFTLKIAAVAATALAILVVSIFLFNFISFSLRINSENALLAFGPRGIFAYLGFFPWGLLAMDIGLVLILQWLLRYFRLGYKIPILYLIGGILIAAAALGFALDTLRINERIEHGRLPPPLAGLYGHARHRQPPGSGMCRCTILAISGNTLTVEDTRGATTTRTVILPLDDEHATTTSLKVGDIVFIAGEEQDGVIRAFGVRKEGSGEELPHEH